MEMIFYIAGGIILAVIAIGLFTFLVGAVFTVLGYLVLGFVTLLALASELGSKG